MLGKQFNHINKIVIETKQMHIKIIAVRTIKNNQYSYLLIPEAAWRANGTRNGQVGWPTFASVFVKTVSEVWCVTYPNTYNYRLLHDFANPISQHNLEQQQEGLATKLKVSAATKEARSRRILCKNIHESIHEIMSNFIRSRRTNSLWTLKLSLYRGYTYWTACTVNFLYKTVIMNISL